MASWPKYEVDCGNYNQLGYVVDRTTYRVRGKCKDMATPFVFDCDFSTPSVSYMAKPSFLTENALQSGTFKRQSITISAISEDLAHERGGFRIRFVFQTTFNTLIGGEIGSTPTVLQASFYGAQDS